MTAFVVPHNERMGRRCVTVDRAALGGRDLPVERSRPPGTPHPALPPAIGRAMMVVAGSTWRRIDRFDGCRPRA
jgi:hypothetical protein